jgi:hypothetical protein
VVGLEQTSLTVSENAGMVEICTVIFFPDDPCPAEFPFELMIVTVSGTAVRDVDYTAADSRLSFHACLNQLCVDVAITDDTVTEAEEFFTYSLAFATADSRRFDLDPANGIIFILDNDGLSCTSTGVTEVEINCSGVRADTTLQCSFDGRPLHRCRVPMVLTSIVSPPGNHSVRIVASTGGESTVPYYIATAATNVPASVPPLEVVLTGGSPRVTESSVEAEFVTTRPVTGARCFLRYENKNDYKDCSSGRVSFTDLSPGEYVLKIYAYNQQSDSATAKIVVTI